MNKVKGRLCSSAFEDQLTEADLAWATLTLTRYEAEIVREKDKEYIEGRFRGVED